MEGIELNPRRKPLILHSDNGSPMKGSTMLETLYQLGVQPSRSRPRVGNDNPYAESVFRTCKYRPEYPETGFVDIAVARERVHLFVRWYNQEHRHSGLKFLTPQQRHEGIDVYILEARKRVYEEARRKNSSHWSRGIRNWHLPEEVWLNPEKQCATSLKSPRRFPGKYYIHFSGSCDNYLDKHRPAHPSSKP